MTAPGLTAVPKNTINAVTNALELLEVLAAHDGARLSDLSQHSGFTLNQTFRLLETLEIAGYVTRERDKRYRLGHKLRQFGISEGSPKSRGICQESGSISRNQPQISKLEAELDLCIL